MEFNSFTDRVKRAFVFGLRKIFSEDPNLAEYRYSDDKSVTRIAIYPEYPYKFEFFPCIVVSIVGGDVSTKYFFTELHKEENNYLVHLGPVYITLEISIHALSPRDRDVLVDKLIPILRIFAKKYLKELGIEYVDVSLLGERMEEVSGRPTWINGFRVEVYTEYTARVDVSAVDSLESVPLETILTFKM